MMFLILVLIFTGVVLETLLFITLGFPYWLSIMCSVGIISLACYRAMVNAADAVGFKEYLKKINGK